MSWTFTLLPFQNFCHRCKKKKKPRQTKLNDNFHNSVLPLAGVIAFQKKNAYYDDHSNPKGLNGGSQALLKGCGACSGFSNP